MAREPNLAQCLFLQMNLSWNMAMPIHLHTVYVCFSATVAELEELWQKLCGLKILKHVP